MRRGGILTRNASDGRKTSRIGLNIDNVRLVSTRVCLSDAQLLILEVVDDVGGAQKGVAEESKLVAVDAVVGGGGDAKHADAVPAVKELLGGGVVHELVLVLGEGVNDHFADGDGDGLGVELEGKGEALVVVLAVGAVDKGDALDALDAKLIVDAFDLGVG